MPTTIERLGIDKLDEPQRIDLALAIWDTLDEERPVSCLTDQQRVELAHRNAEMDARPEIAMTWEEIRARVEKKQ